MPSTRSELLAQLDAWHGEGLLDDITHQRLRTHVERQPDSAFGAPALGGIAAGSTGLASGALQAVGGALLGAALVALTVFLDVPEGTSRAILFGGGLLFGAAGWLLMRAEGRDGIALAAHAAALVALTTAAFLGGSDRTDAVGRAVAAVAAAIAVVLLVLRRNGSPLAPVAVIAFALSFGNALYFDSLFEKGSASPWLGWGALAVLCAWLIVRRRDGWGDGWTEGALGILVIPLTVCFLGILASMGFEGGHSELPIGAHLAAWLGLGIWQHSRGLVTAAAAGIAIDGVVFAFDLGGAITGTLVLLVLGGILIWQAEVVRRWLKA